MSNLLSVEQFRKLESPVVFHASMGQQPPTRVIPGAFVAGLEGDFSESGHPLPHTAPREIQRVFESYGVTDETDVVVYDSEGATAPRVWWLAQVAGLSNVYVLDGGLRAWTRAGGELAAPATPEKGGVASSSIKADPRWDLLVDAPRVHDPADATIVDARSAGRFTGEEDEPRPGLRSGHIPGSVNVPYTEVYKYDGTMKDPADLADMLPAGDLIASCGSGVTACVLALAAREAGRSDVQVYEGSWSEWGRPDSGYPVARGEEK